LVAEGEVFQIKKPSHSKRIVKQLKKESSKNKNDDAAPVKFEVNFGSEQVYVCVSERCIYVYRIYSHISRPAYKPTHISAAEDVAKISDSRISW